MHFLVHREREREREKERERDTVLKEGKTKDFPTLNNLSLSVYILRLSFISGRALFFPTKPVTTAERSSMEG